MVGNELMVIGIKYLLSGDYNLNPRPNDVLSRREQAGVFLFVVKIGARVCRRAGRYGKTMHGYVR